MSDTILNQIIQRAQEMPAETRSKAEVDRWLAVCPIALKAVAEAAGEGNVRCQAAYAGIVAILHPVGMPKLPPKPIYEFQFQGGKFVSVQVGGGQI